MPGTDVTFQCRISSSKFECELPECYEGVTVELRGWNIVYFVVVSLICNIHVLWAAIILPPQLSHL